MRGEGKKRRIYGCPPPPPPPADCHLRSWGLWKPSPTPPPAPPPPPRRVLYPASRSRRPPQREDPDPARRWLLLLCALVFLQIYTEETHTCTELQNQNQNHNQNHNQDTAVPHPQQGERGLCSVQGGTGEEPWRIQMVGGASETQL
ncbi:uncharacterized proline-rich protein-like [Pseudoliparis swirei]|uniref:uncharacterized proline-rich protein-like n=1 Tax=Pseudoliparis swirei TaxID=2059687 RepID=UPI0024BEFB21|nr:uncharacterized proline-rich protein-like [Pseudoliparis swirei]